MCVADFIVILRQDYLWLIEQYREGETKPLKDSCDASTTREVGASM
jgi:hypothetical protein